MGLFEAQNLYIHSPVTMRNGVVVLLLDVKEPWKVSCPFAGGQGGRRQEAGGEEAGEEEIGGQGCRRAAPKPRARPGVQEARPRACTGVSL